MLYPLSYEGGGCRKRGRKPDALVGSGRCLLNLGRSTASVRLATVVGRVFALVRTRRSDRVIGIGGFRQRVRWVVVAGAGGARGR